jgi:hypothetical protein
MSVPAILLERVIGAQYEGFIWNYFPVLLTVRHQYILHTFDPDRVTETLVEGETYNFKLYFNIYDPKKVEKLTGQRLGEGIIKDTQMTIQTIIGDIVTGRHPGFAEGDILAWAYQSRFNVKGIET